jgi:glycosyltransferase involved in cell wall biosynthesis
MNAGSRDSIALSVIIPFRNEAKALPLQLAAFETASWTEPWELLLVDNASSDGSTEVARAYETRVPHAHYLRAYQRRGAAYARNVGASHARGDALAFCDADDQIGKGWLSAIGNALKRHQFVASKYETAKLNPPWVRDAYGDHPQEKGLQRLTYPPERLHASSTGLGIHRSIHQAIGGFDESWHYLEDTDYAIRAQDYGVELHFIDEAVLHYRYRHEMHEIFWQSYHWGKWSIAMYKKHRPAGIRDAWRWRQHLHLWQSLLADAVQSRERGQVGYVVRRIGWQIGRLTGSIQYRVPPVC